MAGNKGYLVLHSFPTKDKTTGQVVDITRENQDRVGEIMTAAKIAEHVASGALQEFDLGDATSVHEAVTAPPLTEVHAKAGRSRTRE